MHIPLKSDTNNKKINIIRAGALGDAFGYNVEFKNWEVISNTFSGNITFLNCDNYIASDDTQMTLFCLEALKENRGFNNDNDKIINKIYEYYLEWNNTQHPNGVLTKEFSKQSSLKKRQAPGLTCLTSLSSRRFGTIDKKINESKGCGAIMRVAPIAFLNVNLDTIIELGCRQGAITHGHPEGYLSAGFFAGLIYLGINNKSFEESYIIIKEKISLYKDSEQFISYLNKTECFYSKIFLNPNEMNDAIGDGWTGETALGLAIYAFKQGSNFENTLIISTNHRGDSDSTASLAAQLYAAFKNINENDLIKYKEIDLYSIIEKSLYNIEIINE